MIAMETKTLLSKIIRFEHKLDKRSPNIGNPLREKVLRAYSMYVRSKTKRKEKNDDN